MYKRILVPVDGSATAERGIAEAIRMAKLMDGVLCFYHAVDDQSVSIGLQSSVAFVDNWQQSLKESGERILRDAKEKASAAGVRCETTLSEDFSDPVAKRVTDEARRCRADLIVMGTHGRRGLKRMLLGSSAEAVLRDSPVPVLLVRDSTPAVPDGAVTREAGVPSFAGR